MNHKKIVLITGASGELGFATLKSFAEKDYLVIAQCFSNLSKLESLIEKHSLEKRNIIIYKCNFDIKDDIKKMFLDIQKKFSKIDILINNAAIILPKSLTELENASYKDLQKVLDINITAQFLCGKLACKLMRKNNYGKIINIGSLAGTLPNYNNGFYSVSKAGLDMLTKSMALQWAKFNILVNSVSPGAIDSSMAKQIYDTKEKLMKRKSVVPLNKLVSLSAIVDAIFFLTSENNNDITGQNIIIDGGTSISYFKVISN